MTNRNAETLTHLYAARTALTAYRAALDSANAATQPSAKLTALYAARAHHADYLAALKRGDYVYEDGKGRINAKLGFDFEQTVIDSGADKWDVWQKVEPLPQGDITAIATLLQAQYTAFIADWRSRIIVEINALLQTKLPNLSPIPDWSGRNFLYVAAARAALESCINQGQVDAAFRSCLVVSTVSEFQTVLRTWLTIQIRGSVGLEFNDGGITTVRLLNIYETMLSCLSTDFACLWNLGFLELQSALNARFAAMGDTHLPIVTGYTFVGQTGENVQFQANVRVGHNSLSSLFYTMPSGIDKSF